MKLGFIGLGAMGAAIAPRLLTGVHSLTVYNRTPSKAEALVKQGASAAQSIGQLADCDVVMSMLADDAAVASVVEGADGLIASLPPGAVHVCMATISPQLAERLASEHAAAKQSLVTAPVLGRPPAAEAGQLVVMPAGEKAAVERCMPLFELIGQTIIPIGEKPSMASIAKIAVNFLLAATIESLSESFALVRKADIDSEDFLKIVAGTIFNSPVYNVYAPLIAREIHKPAAFSMPLGLKDVRLALSASVDLEAPLPIGGVLQSQMVSALARGFAESDWSALGVLAARNAGLEPLEDKNPKD